MNEPIIVKQTVEMQMTPHLLAQAFWSMDSTKQAEFFAAVAVEVRRTYEENQAKPRHLQSWGVYADGEGQWWHLCNDLKANDAARSMLMSMAAPLYLHTLRAY